MSRESLSLGSDTRPPVLYRGEYTQWRNRFLDFIEKHVQAEEIKQSIFEGPAKFYIMIPAVLTNDPLIPERKELKDPTNYSREERARAAADRIAMSFIIMGITNDIYSNIDSKKTAKDMWDEIQRQMQGTKIGNKLKIMNCITAFDNFKAKDDETIEQTYKRFCQMMNALANNGLIKTNLELNVRFLNNLRPEWKSCASNILHNKDLEDLDIHIVYELLMQSEEEVLETMKPKAQIPEKASTDPLALLIEKMSSSSKGGRYQKAESEEEQSDEEEFDESIDEVVKTLALIARFQNKNNSSRFFKNPMTNNRQRSSSSFHKYPEKESTSYEKKDIAKANESEDKIKSITCFKCLKKGHYDRDCKDTT
ncbi:MAG TPA: hypothetical protein VIJ14_00735, partial [Rhabdochlamydiaceae bacterium]